MILPLLACAPEVEPPVEAASVLVPLDAPRLARRMSLDLRGVLPSATELDAVEADPAALDELREAWLEDPRFEERVVAMLAERWHTRVDEFDIRYYDYHLPEADEFRFERSVGEEPLRLMARVVVEDRPWSEVVTADWTMADEMLASIWPIEYPEGGSGWQVSRYTDGRPPVGVLASNGLWWRYNTTSFNQNRSRAAAVTRLLVCEDLLSRPVTFSATPSLLDAEGTAAALATEPYCLTCHATVEPLAAALFGFYPSESFSVFEVTWYHPERERLGPEMLGVQPGWFGTPVDSLTGLAWEVAADPRLPRCAVEGFAAALWRRPVELEDFDRIEALRAGFVEDGLVVRELIRDVLATPEYQAGGLADAADATVEARERTARLLAPDQLASMVEDLTGYRWTHAGFDQLQNDERGYRVLAGGVNGVNVLEPQGEPGLTWALTVKRLAEAAASYAVETELRQGGEPRLFAGVDLSTRPGDPAFSAWYEGLHWRLYAARPDAERVAAAEALWTAIDAESGPEVAWQGLVSALLRDPEGVSQ